jgi:hypothetical protein
VENTGTGTVSKIEPVPVLFPKEGSGEKTPDFLVVAGRDDRIGGRRSVDSRAQG